METAEWPLTSDGYAYVDIVFDGPPSHQSGRFVEVEDATGKSIKFGEWVHRDDGYWVLRIPKRSSTTYSNMSPSEMSSALGIDGAKWASAFVELAEKHSFDAKDWSLMVAWFANAIETARSVTRKMVTEDMKGLLNEACDTVLASTIEKDITEFRREYRKDLFERLDWFRRNV